MNGVLNGKLSTRLGASFSYVSSISSISFQKFNCQLNGSGTSATLNFDCTWTWASCRFVRRFLGKATTVLAPADVSHLCGTFARQLTGHSKTSTHTANGNQQSPVTPKLQPKKGTRARTSRIMEYTF